LVGALLIVGESADPLRLPRVTDRVQLRSGQEPFQLCVEPPLDGRLLVVIVKFPYHEGGLGAIPSDGAGAVLTIRGGNDLANAFNTTTGGCRGGQVPDARRRW
jgi:hypothetical protein